MDFAIQRSAMVDCQLRTNKVTDERVIAAFSDVPRELFLPEERRSIAYVDEDLALGGDRHLMEPMVLARLIQAAAIQPGDIVLDIGCATGYASAIMARLADTVVALEEDPGLAEQAGATLSKLGVDNAVVVEGSLVAGYPKQAPYNAILIAGSVDQVPRAICDQLGEGGRLVTVLKNGPSIGVAKLLQRGGSTTSSRPLFDAATPFMPGFVAEPGFVF